MDDTQSDPVWAGHPAVAAFPNIGSYLGVPIVLADRTFFGTLCGVDPDPKRFTPRHTELLVVLARLLATQIERDAELPERRRAEAALAAERDLLRTVTDAIPDQIYVKDAASRFVRLNRAAARSLGLADAADAIGKTDAAFFPPPRASAFLADERRILATGLPLLDHLESRAEEGDAPRWALTSKVPLRDATGAVTGLVGIGRDVTGLKQTEDALRESDARFRAFMDHQPTIAFLKDADGRYLYINAPFQRLFRVTLADIRGKRDADWLPPTVAAELGANDRRVLETGERFDAVETVPLPDGRRRSWLAFKFPVTDAAGRRLIGGVAIDVTDRQRAGRHAALRADVSGILAQHDDTDAILRAAARAIVGRLDAARATLWLLDETGSALDLRAAASDDPDRNHDLNLDLGPSARVPVGRFRVGRVAAERRPMLTNDLAADRRPDDNDWGRRAGFVSFAGQPLLVEDRLVGVIAVFAREPLADDTLDVLASVADAVAQGVERKRVEAALRTSEDRFRAIVESTAEWIFEVDPAGRFTYTNPAVAAILGYPPDDLLGADAVAFLHEDDRRTVEALAATPAADWRLIGVVHRWRHADGGYRDLGGSFVPALAADGSVVGWRGIARDLTDRERAARETTAALAAQRAANAELERLNKVKSDFVSVVSHELRTPLTSIQGFSELIRDDNLAADEVKEFADDIHRNALHLARMIGDMLDLDRLQSGRTRLRLAPTDPNAVATEVAAALRPTAPRHDLRLDLDPALPVFPADRDRLTQLLTNLVANAVKYAPDGGEVTIATRRHGDEVRLAVRDRGFGIPPEALESVFERYARVESEPGRRIQGTGLGLPIAREIAELHGGRIWVESAVGHGSTFRVALPLTPPASADAPTDAEPPADSDGGS